VKLEILRVWKVEDRQPVQTMPTESQVFGYPVSELSHQTEVRYGSEPRIHNLSIDAQVEWVVCFWGRYALLYAEIIIPDMSLVEGEGVR
jgi:hypothetical protein